MKLKFSYAGPRMDREETERKRAQFREVMRECNNRPKERVEYAKWAAEVTRRAENKCMRCGEQPLMSKGLRIHHQYYIEYHLPWEYPIESAYLLCDKCHEHAEEVSWELGQMLMRMNMTQWDRDWETFRH